MDINKDGQLDKNDLRGHPADVQGLLQADGHQQGWPAGQERPAWRLRQRRCAHERNPSPTVCWARSPDLAPTTTWSRCSRRRWPERATTKMTKAEIDDIFGEFEIDEDYMIKTKDVIGLFVAVKEEPKVEEPAPVEEAPEAEPEEDADAKKKKKKKKKAAK